VASMWWLGCGVSWFPCPDAAAAVVTAAAGVGDGDRRHGTSK
jgi:hypothetical protein